ncbi:MAG: NYN domain-containing protein [Campylobacterota bacterium]
MNQLQEALKESNIRDKIISSKNESKKENKQEKIKLLKSKFQTYINTCMHKSKSIKELVARKIAYIKELFSKHLLKKKTNIVIQNIPEQEWFPTSKEISLKQKELAKNSHLILLDMRYIYYTENEVGRLILKLKKPSEICLIDSKYLNQKQTNLLFPYILLYGLKIVIEEDDVGKCVRRMFEQRQKEFKHVTIADSANISQMKRYRIKGWKPPTKLNVNRKSKKKVAQEEYKKLRPVLEQYPTLEDISETNVEIEKNKNLILWDIENISHREIDNILDRIYKRGLIYCVSVQPLSQKVVDILYPYILLHRIKVVVDHEDSDEKIKELIREHYMAFKQITIVSSDSDFTPIIKMVLGKGKDVKVIAKDNHKKRMLMYLKLDHENLSISTIK